jgi:ABC-type uncharacterized transport system ATPase subunit
VRAGDEGLTGAILLETRELTRRFGGLAAVNRVSLSVSLWLGFAREDDLDML